jgi:hypothetical protein
MPYQIIYHAEGDTAQARMGTLAAFGPAALIKRLDEEGLLAVEEGRTVNSMDPGLGDDIRTCHINKVLHIVTRNTRFGFLTVERQCQ